MYDTPAHLPDPAMTNLPANAVLVRNAANTGWKYTTTSALGVSRSAANSWTAQNTFGGVALPIIISTVGGASNTKAFEVITDYLAGDAFYVRRDGYVFFYQGMGDLGNKMLADSTGFAFASGCQVTYSGSASNYFTSIDIRLGRSGTNSYYLRGDSGASVGPTFTHQGQSSSTSGRAMSEVVNSWATSTDASRKARAIFNVYDTAARECIRLEASGSAAMIGFYGVAAVAQQVLATGASHTVDDVISFLQTVGLCKQS